MHAALRADATPVLLEALRAQMGTAFGLERCEQDERLAAGIGERPTLLVLDNAEDLLRPETPGLQQLLDVLPRHCPALRLLVTSRKLLGSLAGCAGARASQLRWISATSPCARANPNAKDGQGLTASLFLEWRLAKDLGEETAAVREEALGQLLPGFSPTWAEDPNVVATFRSSLDEAVDRARQRLAERGEDPLSPFSA